LLVSFLVDDGVANTIGYCRLVIIRLFFVPLPFFIDLFFALSMGVPETAAVI
jgi:hypothetical protein